MSESSALLYQEEKEILEINKITYNKMTLLYVKEQISNHSNIDKGINYSITIIFARKI